MPFELDPVDYLARTLGTGQNRSPGDPRATFASQFARDYGQKFGQGSGMSESLGGGMDMSGTKNILGGLEADQQMEAELGAGALGAIASVMNAREQAESAESQAKKNRKSATGNAIIGAVGSIGAAAVGAAI